MSRESDLLFGLLALQMNFVSKEQLLQCAAVWMNDPKATLAKLFVERGHLKLNQEAALAAMVAAQMDASAGDPARSLGAVTIDPALRKSLLALNVPPDLRQSLAWVQARGVVSVRTVAAQPAAEGRYRLGAELGRGGLGQVVAAFDTSLEREIAVKLALDGASADVADWFVREAKLSGRLEHPNIVPVHDFGMLNASSTGKAKNRQLFIAMKRVQGHDLAHLLAELAKDNNEERKRWTRTRLLQVFLGICQGVAFAHARGVIHRDLKPANVMLGEFGEVLVMDWGLARAIEERTRIHRRPTEPARRPSKAQAPSMTRDGEVLGTPMYMPPEQADGRRLELDQRSDIYSLGAILYELLSLKAPFEGTSVGEILEKVKSGKITPPSSRVGGPISAMNDPERTLLRPPSTVSVTDPIPPELDAIVLKAMAFRREDRFRSVNELQEEIQLYLEGVQQQEREHRQAEECVGRAKAAMVKHTRLLGEGRTAAEAAKAAEKGVEPWDDKAALWEAQDKAKQLKRDAVDAFSAADAALLAALTHQSGHNEARRLRAELYWKRTLDAEAAADENEQRLNRAVVELYNDGPLDLLLRGDGTLAVRTRAYRCRCLIDGRMVNPDEPAWQGYHPFSGRSLTGAKWAEGLHDMEPKGPGRLKVHAATCEPAAHEGADVWLFRYEETGRRLMPVTPGLCERKEGNNSGRPVPPSVVDALFEPKSPYRPQGPGVWLGRTPIEKHTLPMGSYLLLLCCEGRAPLRVPVFVPRCGSCEQDSTLFRPEEIPPGFLPISAGAFTYQGESTSAYAGPVELRFVDDVFVARHPVTCREYCEFLNDQSKQDSVGTANRVPRESRMGGFYWPGPPYAVPTKAWLSQASPDLKSKARRLSAMSADWEEDWPIVNVSWEDSMAFCAWKRAGSGLPAMLPHEAEWEKSGRGTDRRLYPWGRHCDERWANQNRSVPGGMRPMKIDAFTDDESPYGVRGMGGNSRDYCVNAPGPQYPGWRSLRGGNWASPNNNAILTARVGMDSRMTNYVTGIRVACAVRFARAT